MESVALFLAAQIAGPAMSADAARQAVIPIVLRIQRADYEGDRPALARLHDELAPFVETPGLASRVRYWRGFALWRRALNGFNDSADPKDLEQDLSQCILEFEQTLVQDPAFADAMNGAASCLGNLMFLNRNDSAKFKELLTRYVRALKEAQAAAPDNPRMLWVRGVSLWYSPPERGGGQDAALATYERGLKLARKQKGSGTDPLEPSWGEPELLMNLAFANLNRTTSDLNAAEGYAQAALALVPYWHYVRDILMVQIRKAKGGPTP